MFSFPCRVTRNRGHSQIPSPVVPTASHSPTRSNAHDARRHRSPKLFRAPRRRARHGHARYFAVRLAADPHATPCAALGRVAPRLNVSFARDGLDIRDDGARARDDDVASDGDAPDEPRPRLASDGRAVSRGRKPSNPSNARVADLDPVPPGSDGRLTSKLSFTSKLSSASSPFSRSFVSASSRLPGCLQRG